MPTPTPGSLICSRNSGNRAGPCVLSCTTRRRPFAWLVAYCTCARAGCCRSPPARPPRHTPHDQEKVVIIFDLSQYKKFYWLVSKDLLSECRSLRVWPAMLLLGVVVALMFAMQTDLPPDGAPAGGSRPI